MLADELDYVVGVDTRRDEHVLAVVVAPVGVVVARRAVAANARGYAQALRFADSYASGRRVWAVEGVGHYGAALARYLSGRSETVLGLMATEYTGRLVTSTGISARFVGSALLIATRVYEAEDAFPASRGPV